MAYEDIDLTTAQPNGKKGEPSTTAWGKAKRMFAELYKGRTTTADRLHYFGAQGADAFTPFTSAARNLLDDADSPTMLKTLGLSDYFSSLVAAEGVASFFTKAGAPLQGNPLDFTKGRILLAGAGGLLGDAPSYAGNIDNVDTVPKGTVSVNRSAAGTSGTMPTDFGFLTTFGSTEEAVLQYWDERTGSATGVSRRWKRYGYQKQFGSWRIIFGGDNAVGTVAYANGYPSGAIIERGSNASGNYTRFADGTQICWGVVGAQQQVDQSAGVGFQKFVGFGYYAAAFADTPSVSYGVTAQQSYYAICTSDAPPGSTQTGSIYLWSPSSACRAQGTFVAIGRWR